MKPHRSTGAPARAARGFTLLEVVVALAIIALVLVALVRSASGGARGFGIERDLVLSQWVAANVLAETRLAERFPNPGRRDGVASMAGREFGWEMVVQTTDEPSVRRIDVRVYADAKRQASLYSLVGFSGAP